MTFEEALTTLAVDRSSDEVAVRRAYLSLIKKHSPERDPHGFRRVRAAYELLKEHRYMFGVVRAEPTASLLSRQEAPQLDVTPTVSARIWTIADSYQRLAAAAQNARTSGTAEAYQLWLEVADMSDEGVDTTTIAREAIASGHEQFVSVLRTHAPEALTTREVDDWLSAARKGDAAGWTSLAHLLVERGRVAEAVSLALSVLDREERALQQDTNGWFLVDFALRLLELPDRIQAGRLIAHVARLRQSAASSNPLAASSLRELYTVMPALPDTLLDSIASGLRRAQPEVADTALDAFVRHNPLRARQLRSRFQREAPTLFALYQHHLPAWWRRPRWTWRWWHGFVLSLAISHRPHAALYRDAAA